MQMPPRWDPWASRTRFCRFLPTFPIFAPLALGTTMPRPFPAVSLLIGKDLIVSMTRTSGAFTAEDVRTTTEGGAFTAVAPSHVVGLTCGGRENPVLILDTKYGIIHWEDCPSSVEHGYYSTTVDYDPPEGEDSDEDDERDESAREEELAWRQSAPAWTIPDFFENLKD